MNSSTATMPGPVVRSFNPRPQAMVWPQSNLVNTFGSDMFPTRILDFKAGEPEVVVIGGRDKFALVPRSFDKAGIKQILVIGWGSQGPAQAPNLRDTLKFVGRSDIKVCVGLRAGSKNIQKAICEGFNHADGTLGDPLELASKSDLIICLIADGGMVETHEEIFAAAKPGSIIGLSHGFLVGYLKSIGKELRSNHDFIMVAPKGMGPSVRKLYLQGLKVEGAGINSSVAVQVTNPERYRLVQDVANAWSVGIGSPVTFGTGFLREVTSDLFGERSMLLGGLYGMAVALDGFYRDSCHLDPSMAFRMASSGITGTVTDRLSACGIAGFRRSLSTSQTVKFDKGYVLGYPVFDGVMNDIYQQVSSFEEISMVVEATRGLAEHPMSNIESDSSMWNHAREHSLYGERVMMSDMLAFSAGIYVSGLMAQLQTLLHHGHKVSEVVNESFIEAVDSLTPYMDSRGGGFMVDNCSTTARLGTRLWAPVFRRRLSNVLVSQTERSNDEYARVLQTFADEPLHHDIGLCMGCRPSVRISVPLQN